MRRENILNSRFFSKLYTSCGEKFFQAIKRRKHNENTYSYPKLLTNTNPIVLQLL